MQDPYPEQMFPHQRETLSNYVAAASADPDVEAVILGGSIAKGWHNERSDVDVMTVLNERAYARRRESMTVAVWDMSPATYEGGAVDIKYVGRSWLELGAEKGSEPMRAALVGSTVAWCRGELDAWRDLIARIRAYPESGVNGRIASYLSQAETMRWYIGEAEKRDNAYLASWVASRAVLFGCRAILAYNRVLFPFHKWLLRAVADCPQRPGNVVELADALSRAHTKPNVNAFCDAVMSTADWAAEVGHSPERWAELFIRDTEWKWMTGEPPLDEA